MCEWSCLSISDGTQTFFELDDETQGGHSVDGLQFIFVTVLEGVFTLSAGGTSGPPNDAPGGLACWSARATPDT